MSTIRLNSVSKTFGGTRALDDITCEIPLGHVHGLIGRNGAGKTTLLRSIAGQVVTDGEITIGGEPVRDNQPVLDRIVLGGADIPYPPQMRVRTLMDIGASRWQNWDDSFATHLVDLFGVNTKARFSELSRGQKTLVGNVISWPPAPRSPCWTSPTWAWTSRTGMRCTGCCSTRSAATRNAPSSSPPTTWRTLPACWIR